MARVLAFEPKDPEEAVFTDRVEYTRRYQARVDALPGAPRALYAHNPRLQRGQPHPDDPLARVREFRPTQVPGVARGGTYLFEIEVRWDSTIAPRTNPLQQPAEIEWSTTEIVRAVTRDRDGKPLVTTAGSLLTDLHEELSLWVVDVKKNVADAPAWILDYANAVNADPFRVDGLTLPPRTARLKTLRLGPQQRDEEQRVDWRELQFQLFYQRETWDKFVLNRGLYELHFRRTASGRVEQRQVRILNRDGEPIEEPAFLDEHGQRPRRRVRDEAGNFIPLSTDPTGFVTELKPLPLDAEDILVLRFETARKLPFRVLPVT